MALDLFPHCGSGKADKKCYKGWRFLLEAKFLRHSSSFTAAHSLLKVIITITKMISPILIITAALVRFFPSICVDNSTSTTSHNVATFGEHMSPVFQIADRTGMHPTSGLGDASKYISELTKALVEAQKSPDCPAPPRLVPSCTVSLPAQLATPVVASVSAIPSPVLFLLVVLMVSLWILMLLHLTNLPMIVICRRIHLFLLIFTCGLESGFKRRTYPLFKPSIRIGRLVVHSRILDFMANMSSGTP